jgi:hypothetical protein
MIAWNCKIILADIPKWGTWTPGATYIACLDTSAESGHAFTVIDNEGEVGTVSRLQARIVDPPSPLPATTGGAGGRIAPARLVVDPGAPQKH